MNKEILNELMAQTKWLKFLALPQLSKIMRENIKTKEQKRIFQLSDGENSTNDVAKKLLSEGIKISHMTVYNYWKRWFALGIVIPSIKQKGRFQKIVDLDDINIPS